MERNYTEAVRDGFFDLIENDTVEIWKDLDRSVAMIKSGKWKEHYSEVVAKYRFSSRFAIMRVLFEITTGLSRANTDDIALKKGFEVLGIGKFPDISIKHAKSMADEEVDLYRRLLLLRVEENNPDYYDEATQLINRALSLPAVGLKSNLSRDELIRFGHMVGFSLEHMQFLLLRVLGDNEAGFRHSASMDIIDMYGFITLSSLAQVEEIKTWYFENAAHQKKVQYADKPAHCTQDIADSFEKKFTSWSPENRMNSFKDWLLQQAPYLDVKSKSARKVYLNLAMFAYVSSNSQHITHLFDTKEIASGHFERDVQNVAYGKRFRDYHDYAMQLFYTNAKLDLDKCDAMAAALIYENAAYARNFKILDFDNYKKDSEYLGRLYHTLYVQENEVTARGRENEHSKKRIVDILMDRVSPHKSDLLYLLWIAANSYWMGASASVDEKVQFLDQFLAAASYLLDAAFLPKFYPPNVLEETMMLALALADDMHTPATVYEGICSTFTNQGEGLRPEGVKNKTSEEKREIAKYYYEHLSNYPVRGAKGACKKVCAEKFKVGEASVEIYCDQYVAQYYYDHLAEFPSEDACKKVCADLFRKTIKSVNKCCSKYPKGLA